LREAKRVEIDELLNFHEVSVFLVEDFKRSELWGADLDLTVWMNIQINFLWRFEIRQNFQQFKQKPIKGGGSNSKTKSPAIILRIC
jgi:hypothetical protein